MLTIADPVKKRNGDVFMKHRPLMRHLFFERGPGQAVTSPVAGRGKGRVVQ